MAGERGVDALCVRVCVCAEHLQNRNETLFYRILIDNIKEFGAWSRRRARARSAHAPLGRTAPIVYTPTVGLVCKQFGNYFTQARGMYFSSQDRGQMHAMVSV